MYEKPTIFINTAFEKHAKKGVLFFLLIEMWEYLKMIPKS